MLSILLTHPQSSVTLDEAKTFLRVGHNGDDEVTAAQGGRSIGQSLWSRFNAYFVG